METGVFWFDRGGLVLCVCYIIPDNSTYYTVRNASGDVHLKCVWTSFEDDPTGSWAEDDIEAFELAKLAGNTLFEVGSRSYEDLIPIPGTDWFVQEDPTPDTIYRPEPSR